MPCRTTLSGNIYFYAMSTDANKGPKDDAIIGVSDHGGWAVLVTVADDGKLLDRRRVVLVDDDLPKDSAPQ